MASWDDYDDGRYLQTGGLGDEEGRIDLQSLPEARTRRGVSEHDDGLIVRDDTGYDKNGFEPVKYIAREERRNLERRLGR